MRIFRYKLTTWYEDIMGGPHTIKDMIIVEDDNLSEEEIIKKIKQKYISPNNQTVKLKEIQKI